MNKLFVYISILILACVACSEDELPNNNYNQLQVDGAVLPVQINGDKSSDVALIVVHGGPGESAILKQDAIGFNRLEQEHLVVYYDQRASGISGGNVPEESITLEQMTEDLEAVVELTDEITNASKFFVIGLDWGNAIAANYLAENPNTNVKGYFAVNPTYNSASSLSVMRDTLNDLVQIFNDTSAGSGDALSDFLNSNPFVTPSNYRTYFSILESVAGIVFNTNFEKANVDLPAYSERSYNNNIEYVTANYLASDQSFLQGINVEDKLPAINVPVKLIWGSHNLLFPLRQSYSYLNQLGAASDAEQISIFRNSALRPYYEEGDRFYALVSTWVTLFE